MFRKKIEAYRRIKILFLTLHEYEHRPNENCPKILSQKNFYWMYKLGRNMTAAATEKIVENVFSKPTFI